MSHMRFRGIFVVVFGKGRCCLLQEASCMAARGQGYFLHRYPELRAIWKFADCHDLFDLCGFQWFRKSIQQRTSVTSILS